MAITAAPGRWPTPIFVTAMMAFFLLMWLLNATTEEQRKGLADYFNPNNVLSRSSSAPVNRSAATAPW